MGEERSRTAPPAETVGFREGTDAELAPVGPQPPARPSHPTFQVRPCYVWSANSMHDAVASLVLSLNLLRLNGATLTHQK